MTADGRDGAGNRRSAFGLSRRRLLAGLGGIGAIGAASGAGTSAYFTDAASFAGNDIGSGEVEIDIACESRRNCTVEDGHVTFAFDRIDRGDGGEQRFHVGVQTNPARLWLGTDCPPAFDPLGDAIDASLSARIGSSETTLSSGTLAGIRRDLVSGIRLDDLDGDVCLDPNGDPIELVLDWSLPDDAPGRAAGQSTSFGFQLYTEQCRHVSEDDAEGSNPFAGADDCPDPCVICADDNGVKIGTLTLRYEGTESATLEITSLKGNTDGVLFAGGVSNGDEFAVHADDVSRNGRPTGKLGPEIRIDRDDGEEQTDVHVSCSKPLFVGDAFGDDEKYVIVDGITTDDEPLCGSEDLQ